MRTKANQRPLMRQKFNIGDVLIKSYVQNYLFDIRQMIHPSLMEADDIGKKFEHQGREFEILGMTQTGTLMLREATEDATFFWECTRYFVQMKLGRFNRAFRKINGLSYLEEIPYEEHKILLPPLPSKRGRKASDNESDEDKDQEMESTQEEVFDFNDQDEDQD